MSRRLLGELIESGVVDQLISAFEEQKGGNPMFVG